MKGSGKTDNLILRLPLLILKLGYGRIARENFTHAIYCSCLYFYFTQKILDMLLGGIASTWEDINFDTKTINLNRQIVYIIKRGYFFSAPKTESSNRYITIDNFLLSELQKWKLQQAENEQSASDSYIFNYETTEGKLI